MQIVLFICTGNYYRSRFSEYLFNAHAIARSLGWRADSRGLALERGANNVGAISPLARAALRERGIGLADDLRFPRQLTEEDAIAANRLIAVDESEHRLLLAERFPRWEPLVEYWQVHDIDRTEANIALAQLEAQVLQLVDDLVAQRIKDLRGNDLRGDDV